jgi:hypothetical protein
MKKTAFVSVAIFIAAGVSATLMSGDEPQPMKPAAKEVWLPWPKVTVSKETTYFTGPLRVDGSVDYVAAFNRRCSEGVTPENNAAVALWRACGPWDLDKNIRKQYFKMLGIADLPDKGEYLALYEDFPEYKAAKKQPGKEEEFATKAWQDYSAAVESPWSKKDYPLWAAVLEQDEKTLNALTEGLQRPRFYLPLISWRELPAMLSSCDGISGVQGALYAVRLLRLRAMLRVHDRDVAGAWKDIIALYRMGRLESQRPFQTGWLAFGLLCDGMAGEAAVTLSQQKGLTAAQAREFQKQLLGLPAMRSLGEFCDEGERCRALESLILLAAPHGLDGYFASEAMIDNSQHGKDERKKRVEAVKKLAAHNDIDWTEVFRQYNLFQDQLAEVCGGPASGETLAMLEKLESKTAAQAKSTMDLVLAGDPSVVERMSRDVKAQHIAKLAILPGALHLWRMDIQFEQKRQALERMTLLAFALAGYRADHREYPKTLSELVPAYVDALPKDPFSGELHYKSENGGYLLYSVGENGKDDGGRRVDRVPGASPRQAQDWDDISIRTPAKEAK